jgi:DNA-binding LacI/PurR family transcriptional regulator
MNKQGKYKYETLIGYIKNSIESGLLPVGEKVLSEPEISKKFNISRNTIRQAMKELESAGYLYRVRGKGTFVAEPDIRKSNKIALVLYDLNYMTHPFTGEMIKGIGSVIERENYSLEILATSAASSDTEDLFADSRYAGFIFGAYQTERKIVADAIAKNVPFVFAKNYLPGLKINAVLIDYEKAGYMLAEHLLSMGHEKIALLAAGKIPISEEFTAGVEKAFSAKAHELNRKDIFNTGFSSEALKGFIEALSDYSAIITMDDNMAIELVKLFKAAGKNVPEDVSVTGCNDIEGASLFQPGITTVRLPIGELGAKAAEKLIAKIRGQQEQGNIILEPELIIRSSTAGIPHNQKTRKERA